MLQLLKSLAGVLRRQSGQDMVEYALITAVVVVAIVMATVFLLEPALESWASALADCVSSADPARCFP